MDLFHAMKVFVKVADAGSLSGAARALALSNPSVTRLLAELESHVGARLFNRSTRRLSLTEAGAAYLERCRQVLLDIDDAALAAGRGAAEPSGTLRINAPVSFAVNHLGPVLAQYAARYPQVHLDVTLSDRVVDLVDEGYDLAIRIGRIRDSSLVARQIAPLRMLLCAAPSYLASHGTPATPRDLAQHVCLHYSYWSTRDEWQFARDGKTHAVRIRGSLQANNGDLLRAAALAGMGIILQPSFIIGDDVRRGTLIPLLPDYQAAAGAIHAVYPSRRYLSAKVRTFVDFLVERFGAVPEWDAGLVG
ncbi:LysR family transcriptional regulator [Undibacterium arcticum]|uniref:LysR family transcriptional regulator n=1 Tax=Undibacterium arcticum TaxID=1762892 RepID=A0ABV7F091_9BURK